MVDAAAASDSIVLLRGESGTGKDLLARRLHQKSRRAGGPYIRVNGAAVPLELWESEFFGHRRGSFTGASADREGWFQLAHRGTLFLDEVGAMPSGAQPKLLRAIQDGEFHRLGEQQPTRVDVRIVAATNADLESDIKDGRFRADLYYRLNVLQIRVPPLRDRPEDIVLLARAFAAEVAARLGRPAPEIEEETLARLVSYPWPGNVRELRSVIERALILHPGRGLGDLDLAPEPVGPAAPAPGAQTETAPGSASDADNPDDARKPEPARAIAAHGGPAPLPWRAARGGTPPRHRRAQPRLLLPQARPRPRHPRRIGGLRLSAARGRRGPGPRPRPRRDRPA
jgi:transcriptional regulator with PAS, ATPase and Fis domain